MSKKPSREPSEEERKLFETVLKDTKPLKPAHKASPLPSPPPKAKAMLNPASPRQARHVSKAVPQIGGHVAARLRRGRTEPEARLDLHGFYEAEAHAALERFLIRARGEGLRLVLVITGKSGVLHKNVPRWLAENMFRDFVAGVSEAHIHHGGAGAYYIALRRDKER